LPLVGNVLFCCGEKLWFEIILYRLLLRRIVLYDNQFFHSAWIMTAGIWLIIAVSLLYSTGIWRWICLLFLYFHLLLAVVILLPITNDWKIKHLLLLLRHILWFKLHTLLKPEEIFFFLKCSLKNILIWKVINFWFLLF